MESVDRELLIETRDIARDTARDVVSLTARFEVVQRELAQHRAEERNNPIEQKRLSLDLAGRIAQWTSAGIAAAAILIAVLK